MSSKYRTTLNVKRLTEFRHDLHMHPELKFMEHRTSDKIAAFLTELDIPYKRGLASTGIVGSIYGKNRSANDPGPALGIRADIDALPLEEANKFTHASKHKGCMHGCGHDGHTAMLLGAAELLSANRDFDGTIHLIFSLVAALPDHLPCPRSYALTIHPFHLTRIKKQQGGQSKNNVPVFTAHIHFASCCIT